VEGLFPDQDGWYATFGYRAGKFLPHITVASVESEPLQVVNARQGNTQDSVTLGLRYEVNDSAAFKFEYKAIELDDTSGSSGFFSSDVNGAVPTDDKASVVSVALDVIF
jgi:predicted porin